MSVHIRESSQSDDQQPRVKPPPKSPAIPVPFTYIPSDDGTDENLLIILHGLGDSHVPFAKMGRQLKLPQTAVLSLRAPDQIPYLEEDAFQWYTSFDHLGELIEQPNPTPAVDLLTKVVGYLIKDRTWPAHRLHLFGFAQGGTVAAEFGVKFWRDQLQEQGPRAAASSSTPASSLGSIVSVSGPLLSWPTLQIPTPTPVLLVHRPPPSEAALPQNALVAYKKGYQIVSETKLSTKHLGMPASEEEWESIMRFWSEKLGRRKIHGLYEVMGGFMRSE
ncbi:hypothetical protein AX17_001718 [Amanita inopinata Kibby_2008]|nr:hypothetical protein AX17_001718 [Amanita inopinata Kibby_2008]